MSFVGFGLDSVIEVMSALAPSWQFSPKDPERREHLTLRIIAISFLALAAFVTADAIRALTGREEAQHPNPGIVIAALSLAIMPVLSWAQRRAERELGSRTAVADSKQTVLCMPEHLGRTGPDSAYFGGSPVFAGEGMRFESPQSRGLNLGTFRRGPARVTTGDLLRSESSLLHGPGVAHASARMFKRWGRR